MINNTCTYHENEGEEKSFLTQRYRSRFYTYICTHVLKFHQNCITCSVNIRDIFPICVHSRFHYFMQHLHIIAKTFWALIFYLSICISVHCVCSNEKSLVPYIYIFILHGVSQPPYNTLIVYSGD